MQVESFGFSEGRSEACPEESACRNGSAPLLPVSTRCHPCEGPSSEVGTALGRQRPGDRNARGAGTPGEKPRGRSAVPQFDAQTRPAANRLPAAFGMAERRESVRGKTRHIAQPSGNSANESHSSWSSDTLRNSPLRWKRHAEIESHDDAINHTVLSSAWMNARLITNEVFLKNSPPAPRYTESCRRGLLSANRVDLWLTYLLRSRGKLVSGG
jgi:hypothetical protein